MYQRSRTVLRKCERKSFTGEYAQFFKSQSISANAKSDDIYSGIIAEKSSESLFTLDTTGSEAIQKSYNKAHKPLKADQIWAQRSAVPQIDTHKRPRGTTDGVIEPTTKKQKRDGVSRKEYERLRQVAYNGRQIKDIIETEETTSHDPWNADPTADAVDPRFDYLEKQKPIVMPKTLKEAPISMLESGKAVPAVLKPRADASYNPLFEDWNALYHAEGEKAVVAERKRLAEAQLELESLQRVEAARNERERDEEWLTEEESAWEGFESEVDEVDLTRKRPERKTPQERRKAERRKEREREEKAEKRAKEKDKTEKRILEIKRQIDKDAKEKARRQVKKEVTDDGELDLTTAALRRRKLGKDVLPERSLELVLPDELQESLRLLKPEGNLLKERFRSILMRGKMETRKPIQQPKKKKRTVTEKWTYKDFEVGA